MYRLTYKNAQGKDEDYGADFNSVRQALYVAANNGLILDSHGVSIVEKKSEPVPPVKKDVKALS
jgi:hypothetical protein